MIKSSFAALAAAAVIGLGALAGSAAPAAADSAYFGFSVGGRGDPAVRFGFSSGYPAYRDYAPYPRYREYYAPYPRYDSYRPVYRHARPVEVCKDVWRTRRVRDEWGRVVKVVKVRDERCHVEYR